MVMARRSETYEHAVPQQGSTQRRASGRTLLEHQELAPRELHAPRDLVNRERDGVELAPHSAERRRGSGEVVRCSAADAAQYDRKRTRAGTRDKWAPLGKITRPPKRQACPPAPPPTHDVPAVMPRTCEPPPIEAVSARLGDAMPPPLRICSSASEPAVRALLSYAIPWRKSRGNGGAELLLLGPNNACVTLCAGRKSETGG